MVQSVDMTLGIHRSGLRSDPRPRHLGPTFVALLTLLAALLVAPGPAAAATPISVDEAIGTQDGSTATVRGYVVGQPVSTDRVVTDSFPNDYALALADEPGETDTGAMVYVQVPSEFRSAFGLQSNPDLMGAQLDVTGTLTDYFAHPGLKEGSAFSVVGDGEDPGDPDPGDPGDYYADAEGKTGQQLRDALHTIISDQETVSYDEVWEALQVTDEDQSNASNVILFYSGRSQAKSQHGGGVDDWNREHVWAKSHGDFGTRIGPGTDLHHLRPTDSTVNSTRSNKDFDNGGDPVEQCAECATDGDSFEPPDRVKGDVARMILYMAVRYDGTSEFPDLRLNDEVENGSAPYHGRLSVLLQWHQQDPPSAFEERRNEVIFEQFQHNRNPFIDHPEWVGSIWN